VTPLHTAFLFVGVFLGVLCLVKVLGLAQFQITKKPPPAVRISPELLDQYRSEIVFRAIKQGPSRVVRADFNRSHR